VACLLQPLRHAASGWAGVLHSAPIRPAQDVLAAHSYLRMLRLPALCRRMRDDLQQMRDKTVELEIKLNRVRG
jgi:hypothetical protein